VAPTVVTKTRVFLPPVHFPLDVHLVQKREVYKVELAAKYLDEDQSRTLHLEGYADRKTGNPKYNQGISERRVREVRRWLVEKYGIDPNRLTIGWQGDLKQPFDVNELNRAVLFIGDDDTFNLDSRYGGGVNSSQMPSRQEVSNVNPYTQQGYSQSSNNVANVNNTQSQSSGNYYAPPAAPQHDPNQYVAPNSGNTYQFNK